MQMMRTAMQCCLRSNIGHKAHTVPGNMVSQSDLVRKSTSLVPDTRYEMLGPGGGFTIIEILIVIVILAIAAMTVVPMMSSAASMQIRSAANMIAADLEYAKSMAISRGQYFSVVFDKTTESYRIEDQDDSVIPHPVRKGSDYIIDFRNDSRLSQVNIDNVILDPDSSPPTITFDYLGSPYSGTGTSSPLNADGVVNLQAGSMTRRITVEPVTGYISIED